jgi:hypothetical protein
VPVEAGPASPLMDELRKIFDPLAPEMRGESRLKTALPGTIDYFGKISVGHLSLHFVSAGIEVAHTSAFM